MGDDEIVNGTGTVENVEFVPLKQALTFCADIDGELDREGRSSMNASIPSYRSLFSSIGS